MINRPRYELAIAGGTQVPTPGRGLRPSHKALIRHVLLLMSLLLCASAAVHAAGPGTAVEPAELGSTARVHEFDGALLAGQPDAADLAIARERGVKTVISLRRDTESVGFDERAEAARLGLAYVSLPWSGPDELTDAVFDEARRLLRETPRPLLLHCGSANRVAAVWLPWRVLDDGAEYDPALAEARQIGLTTPEFEQKAKDYIDRQQRKR
jgi:protein tyrosine phosphatase (PTP) superfamily phosphohydrolase (DUF442 family)